jgi:hypothetical protein
MFSLMNVLISGVIAKDQDNIQKRLVEYNETSDLFTPFVTND